MLKDWFFSSENYDIVPLLRELADELEKKQKEKPFRIHLAGINLGADEFGCDLTAFIQEGE